MLVVAPSFTPFDEQALKPNWTKRVRSTVLLVLGALAAGYVPLLVFVALSYQHTLARSEQQLLQIAQIAVRLGDEAFDRASATLTRLARVSDLEPTPATARLFSDAVYGEPLFREIGIVDQDGMLVYSTADRFEEPFAASPGTRADPSIAHVQMIGRVRTRVMGHESIMLALPVPERGELNLLIDPEVLTLAFDQLDLGQRGFLAFVDGRGNRLATSGNPPAEAVLTTSPPSLKVVVPASRADVAVHAVWDRRRVLADWYEHLTLAMGVGAIASIGVGVAIVRVQRRSRGLDQDLRAGIERDELRVLYQPIIDLETGECVGAEALLRWQHPTHGVVPPGIFIPVAAQAGLMSALTDWLLARTTQDFAVLVEANPALSLAVNCPSSLFDDGRLERLLAARVVDAGLARHFVVEITEDSFVGDRAQAIAAVMDKLRRAGLRFALDDFGTGYSGLAAIRDLRFDYLKIDRAFVQVQDRGAAGVLVLDALLDLAAKLGAEPIAEGIETEAQRTCVQTRAVRLAQGWLFARALDRESFVAFAIQRRPGRLDGP